jgi:hypothetical protein
MIEREREKGRKERRERRERERKREREMSEDVVVFLVRFFLIHKIFFVFLYNKLHDHSLRISSISLCLSLSLFLSCSFYSFSFFCFSKRNCPAKHYEFIVQIEMR